MMAKGDNKRFIVHAFVGIELIVTAAVVVYHFHAKYTRKSATKFWAKLKHNVELRRNP